MENGKYEISYYLGNKYRGQKIMSNAMNVLMMNLSMSSIGELQVACRESNTASKKIIERIASHFETRYDAYYKKINKISDSKIEKTSIDTKISLKCVIEKTLCGKIVFNHNI